MPNAKLEEDLAALKEIMLKLQDQISELNFAKTTEGEKGSKSAKSILEEGLESGLNLLRGEFSDASAKGKKVLEEVQERFADNPLLGLAVAFGAGFLLGKLVERK
jgi:ElaB/YqjD/DUF883 family membrane-anchored ribosome-binding protein